MIVKTIAQCKDPEIIAQPWEIEHTVELPPGEFRYFKEHLLRDQPFIAEHAQELYKDSDGVTHGMLVLCEGIDDGILVNSEGFAYARYAAYLSGARTFSLMNRYPPLRDFCVQMDSLVDKFVQQAIENQEDGQCCIGYADIESEAEQMGYDQDIPSFSMPLFLDMLYERPEFSEVETTHNEVYLTLAPDLVQEQGPTQSM